jgi:perosamine synthetase
VHVLGHPVDLDAIQEVAHRFRLVVVEDAAEALGAQYLSGRAGGEGRWRPVGGLSDISALSFNGNKIVTCGGGGMVVTGRSDWAEQAHYLVTQAKDDAVEYVHEQVGFNYRLTSVQAAIGSAQLAKLPGFVGRKREIAARYATELADVPGVAPMPEADWARSSFWLYTVLIDGERYGCPPRTLLQHLLDHSVGARPLWQPLHRSPAHSDTHRTSCEVADRLHAQGISLPCSVSLTEEQQSRVIELIRGGAG